MLGIPRFTPEVEADYQAYLGPEKIHLARLTAWVAVLLFGSFAVLDPWAVPGAMHAVWALRGAVVGVSIGMAWLVKARPEWLLAHYEAVTATYFGSFGAAVLAMIALASPGEIAWHGYYVGLVLVAMALYTFNFLRPLTAGMVGLAMLAAYLALGLGVQGLASVEQWPQLVTHAVFMVGGNVIGIVVVASRERFSRQAYLLRNALQRDVELKDEAHRRSVHLAEHDALTGLPNRMQFLRRVDAMVANAGVAGGERHVAVLFVDLDGFKAVNDTHGHATGDRLLQEVGRRIRGCVRPNDPVARLGGDEFVIALEITGEPVDVLTRVGESVVAELSQPFEIDGLHAEIGASVGAAVFPGDGSDAAALLDRADAQMYAAKRAGKARLRVTLPGPRRVA